MSDWIYAPVPVRCIRCGWEGQSGTHHDCQPPDVVAMANDLRHALGWIAVGIVGLFALALIRGVEAAIAHHWVSLGINAVCAIALGFAWLDTNRRADRYRRTGRGKRR